MRIISTFIFLFTFYLLGSAQTRILKGTVYNERGMPLNAASLFLFKNGKVNNNKGTRTDKEGNFILKIFNNDVDSIMCSYIGYDYQVENIRGNDSINIILSFRKNRKQVFFKEEEKITFERKIWGVLTKRQKTKYEKNKTEKLKQEKLQNEINGIPIKRAVEDDYNFMKVEIEAQYPYGEEGLKKYFEGSIIYPNADTLKSAEGIVEAGFTINKNGIPTNFKIIKGVNIFANEAVLNALKKMRSWTPAVQNGLYIEQYFEFSFEFKIKHTIVIQNDGKPYE